MEMIQNAYQGFAKQNYTMLDNLKLGYGGTKEEMARLIEDAAKLSDTVDAQDMSFANIVKAINVVQTEMGITGTTAKEAASTISGSVSSMKSAWDNLITGIADDNADLEQLVDNFVTTIVGDGTENNLGVLGNVMPAVEMALKGAAKVVAQSAPIIAKEFPKLMEEILPELASATANLIVALADQIPSMAQTLVDAAFQIVDEIGNAFEERIPSLSVIFENLETVVVSLTAAMVAYKTASAISGIIDTLRKATEGQTLAQTLLNAVMNANPFVLVTTLVVGLAAAIVSLWNTNEDFRVAVIKIWNEIQKKFSDAWNFIVSVWNRAKPYFETIWGAIKTTFSVVKTVLGEFFSSAWYAIQGVWNVATGYFSNVWNTIKGIFSAVEAVLRGDFEGAWNAIKNVLSGWGAFFQGLFDEIGQIFSGIWSVFENIGSSAVEALKQGISNAWSGIVSWFNGLWNSLFGNRNVSVRANVSKNGSHAGGLAYVPFDGYIAELHKGERVLTAREADEYRKNGVQGGTGFVVNQTIYAAKQTPVELAAATRAAFQRARWATV